MSGADPHLPSSAAVSFSPSQRPDEAMRSTLRSPSTFLTKEQILARDRFLRRIAMKNEGQFMPPPARTDTREHEDEELDDVEPEDDQDASRDAVMIRGTWPPDEHPLDPHYLQNSNTPAAGSSPASSTALRTSGKCLDAAKQLPKSLSDTRGNTITPAAAQPANTEAVIYPHCGAAGLALPVPEQVSRRHAPQQPSRRRAASLPSRVSQHPRMQEEGGEEDEPRGVYAIPSCSYYVAPSRVQPAIETLLDQRRESILRENEMRQAAIKYPVLDSASANTSAAGTASRRPSGVSVTTYRPMYGMDHHTNSRLRAQHGRMLEEQRYKLPRCPPYRIPLYDQACLKYIFPNLFDSDFQFMEIYYWLFNVALVIVQIVMVTVNVFFSEPQSYILSWVETASTVVFSVEFGVTMALLLFMVVIILHATITENIGTKLAQDVAALVTFIGTFSILRAVGLASPSFAIRRIAPQFLNAISFWDVLVGFGMVLLWLAVCLLACVALIVKVTQIDFAYSTSITEWSVLQFIQLIGLLMNLARVDDSYYKEISVLLDAVHHHFSTPGEAREANSMEKPCLLARLMRFLRIPNYMYYEYFDAIFNYHMDWARFEDQQDNAIGRKKKSGTEDSVQLKKKKKTYNIAYQGEEDESEAYTFDEIPVRMKWRNMFNYLSFVFEIDTVQLRRYLQMVQSPLPFYRVGRDSFLLSFAESDPVGMDMAVWRSDPIYSDTRQYAKKHPNQFNIGFACEDHREIWDPDYKLKTEKKEKAQDSNFVKEFSHQVSYSIMRSRRDPKGKQMPRPPPSHSDIRGSSSRRRRLSPAGGHVPDREFVETFSGANTSLPSRFTYGDDGQLNR